MAAVPANAATPASGQRRAAGPAADLQVTVVERGTRRAEEFAALLRADLAGLRATTVTAVDRLRRAAAAARPSRHVTTGGPPSGRRTAR